MIRPFSVSKAEITRYCAPPALADEHADVIPGECALHRNGQVAVDLGIGRFGQRDGGCGDPRLDLGKDAFLPGQALHLPDAQRNEDRHAPDPEGERPDHASDHVASKTDARLTGRAVARCSDRSLFIFPQPPPGGARHARGAAPPDAGSGDHDGLAPDVDAAKRNSQTTSTKCQYQAAASNPMCFSAVKWPRPHAHQADEQEDRADDHVEAVEARRHEEVGAVDLLPEIQCSWAM
jgi:hypothetical protein